VVAYIKEISENAKTKEELKLKVVDFCGFSNNSKTDEFID